MQGREFAVESGSLTYGGTTQPEISARATTEIHNVKVRDRLDDVQLTVSVGGTLDVPTVTLSSDQGLSQEELVSLVATGSTGTNLSSGGRIVGQQAAALFAERFTHDIAHGLMDLGFDTVDIQPELLSRETDPGARFTFSKDVTPRIRLVYSFGLNSPEAQYYQLQYRLRPGREALRRYYLEMVFGPYPGARFDVIAGAEENDEVVLIYRFSDATAPSPWSTLAATSWSLAGGLITHDRAVWDTRRASGAAA